jgi:hypothetical protein
MTVDIVVVAALVTVPGVGAALAAAAPGALAIETRIAFVFALGYAVVAGVATLLALAHALSRPTFVAPLLARTRRRSSRRLARDISRSQPASRSWWRSP